MLEELEEKLAKLKNTQACLVFGSGFLANIGLIPALAGSDDLILVDELAHACLNSGARLSGAKVIRFKHNDCADLENHLTAQRKSSSKCLILTDTVFSMDGDLAPLQLFETSPTAMIVGWLLMMHMALVLSVQVVEADLLLIRPLWLMCKWGLYQRHWAVMAAMYVAVRS